MFPCPFFHPFFKITTEVTNDLSSYFFKFFPLPHGERKKPWKVPPFFHYFRSPMRANFFTKTLRGYFPRKARSYHPIPIVHLPLLHRRAHWPSAGIFQTFPSLRTRFKNKLSKIERKHDQVLPLGDRGEFAHSPPVCRNHRRPDGGWYPQIFFSAGLPALSSRGRRHNRRGRICGPPGGIPSSTPTRPSGR